MSAGRGEAYPDGLGRVPDDLRGAMRPGEIELKRKLTQQLLEAKLASPPDDWTAVEDLVAEANRVYKKLSFLRAADAFGKAAAAAEAKMWPNCLITAFCRTNEAMCMSHHADSLPPGNKEAAATRHRVLSEVVAAVIPTLVERRLHGTLLAGSLRAHELRWYTGSLAREYAKGPRSATENPAERAQKCACLAEMLGHATWVLFAEVALSCMLECGQDAYQEAMSGGAQQTQMPVGYIPLIVQAVDLIIAPRPALSTGRENHRMWLEATTLAQETLFQRDVSHAGTRLANSVCFGPLAPAWERWRRSGVIERRYDEGEARALGESLEQMRPTCGHCGSRAEGQQKCAACKSVYYCCKDHQIQSWPLHKAECKRIRKAAEAASA